MAYVKQTWQTGDTITAEKLNHIESGIENSSSGAEPLIVHINGPESEGRMYADRTYKEVHDALAAGRTVLYSYEDPSFDESLLTCIISAGFYGDNNPPGIVVYYTPVAPVESRFCTLNADSKDGYLYEMLSD